MQSIRVNIDFCKKIISKIYFFLESTLNLRSNQIETNESIVLRNCPDISEPP